LHGANTVQTRRKRGANAAQTRRKRGAKAAKEEARSDMRACSYKTTAGNNPTLRPTFGHFRGISRYDDKGRAGYLPCPLSTRLPGKIFAQLLLRFTNQGGAMGIAQLQGKRTGRPRGSKSTSPALRGLLWASRHVGKNVEPPTEAARYWLRLAQERPEAFVVALAALEVAKQRPRADQDAASSATSLMNTRWVGFEGSATQLTFEFQPHGKVRVLRLQAGTYFPNDGTWNMQADHVTIELRGLTWQGTIKGDAMKGTGLHRESGKSWSFSVARQT
jgi:hypothetical protein